MFFLRAGRNCTPQYNILLVQARAFNLLQRTVKYKRYGLSIFAKAMDSMNIISMMWELEVGGVLRDLAWWRECIFHCEEVGGLNKMVHSPVLSIIRHLQQL